MISTGCFLMTSATGTRATACRCASWENSGVSITLSRTHRPITTSTRLARNGIRHAQALNAPSAASAIAVMAPVPSSSPTGTPTCGQLAIRPRRRWLPHSMDSSTEPLHSPPTAMPCSTRSTTRRTGAATPMLEVPGSTPTSALAIPIISSVTMSVALRPSRSPQCPKIAAPTGRAANPTA